jgi:uncharacterized protein YecT (DUF1311 family)
MKVRVIYIMLVVFSLLLICSDAFCMDETDKCGASTVDHVGMRKCLQQAAKAANNELIKAENKLISLLHSWDQDQNWRDMAIERFKLAATAFRRYQKQQCDFEGSRAAGGNGAGDMRLACIYRLAKERTKLLLKQQKSLND